nr:MAG TPA: NQRA C-terminal domain [Caudoviricetes sp.]
MRIGMPISRLMADCDNPANCRASFMLISISVMLSPRFYYNTQCT